MTNLVKHAPLLAAHVDLQKLKYPVLVSPKLDGIRCVVVENKPLSRKLKLIPNLYVQYIFAQAAKQECRLNGLDGELIVGKPYGEGVFQRTTSGIMSKEGAPSFMFYVFDRQGPRSYVDRFLHERFPHHHFISKVSQQWVKNEPELMAAEAAYLAIGYEGIIIRDPEAAYKHGRSTVKEGTLLKLVRFATDEATIVGFKEQMHNDNLAEMDNLGHTKRSSHKAGKRASGVLGSFIVESENYRDVFDVGTGFTADQRVAFWNKRRSLAGKLIRFKHKPVGAVDAPRHPVFQGFRSKIDL